MELIKIGTTNFSGNDLNSVSLKELYGFLGLDKTHYSRWITRNIRDNDFAQYKIDYIISPAGEVLVTVDFAKKLSMITNSLKGNEVREYFLKCERVAKDKTSLIPQTLPEALRFAADLAEKNLELEKRQQLDAPKVKFAETIEGSTDNISMAEMAKLSGKLGRNNLFAMLRQKGILQSDNVYYQTYHLYFKLSEKTIRDGKEIKPVTLVTPKGQLWIIKKLEEWL